MFAEVIGGILTKSLALLSDAGHMVSGAMSIALALVALRFAEREATVERTFGYQRLEALAAMVNALTLWVVGFWVLIEAYHRVQDVPDVEGLGMLIVGVLGLLVNVLAAWVLHSSAKDSINVEGAFQHVMADLLGSVGVVISGIVLLTTGWNMVDPILSVVITRETPTSYFAGSATSSKDTASTTSPSRSTRPCHPVANWAARRATTSTTWRRDRVLVASLEVLVDGSNLSTI